MSDHDTSQAPEPRRSFLRSVSLINWVVILPFLALGIVSIVAGNWFVGGVVIAACVAQYAFARWSRGRRASDLTRVNSLEYSDERDRNIAMFGFAVVGVVALIGVLVALLVVILTLPDEGPLQFGLSMGVIVLYAAWGIGNWWAARRM